MPKTVALYFGQQPAPSWHLAFAARASHAAVPPLRAPANEEVVHVAEATMSHAWLAEKRAMVTASVRKSLFMLVVEKLDTVVNDGK